MLPLRDETGSVQVLSSMATAGTSAALTVLAYTGAGSWTLLVAALAAIAAGVVLVALAPRPGRAPAAAPTDPRADHAERYGR